MAKTNKYAAAAKEAQQQTDEKYKNVISSLTRLTDEEIDKLFPERTDKDRLLELMDLVNQDTDENKKVARLKENAEKFGVIALKLLKLLV
jgi:hypothetical protein